MKNFFFAGLPAVPVFVYCVVRGVNMELNTKCWIELADPYEWLINSIIIAAFAVR